MEACILKENIHKLKERGWFEIDDYHAPSKLLIDFLSHNLEMSFDIETTILEPKIISYNGVKTLSSEFGLSNFPYHTDGANYTIPPRFIILRSLSRTPSEVATLLIDINSINNHEAVRFFEEELYQVTGKDGLFYTNLYSKTRWPGARVFRYNEIIMRPLSKVAEHQFQNHLNLSYPYRLIWPANRISVIDNWRVIHGREAIPTDQLGQRKLERTYLFIKKP